MYPIPANAMRIRYLESTGTQYIDTGIVPTQTTKIEFAYLLTQTPTDSYAAAFGCLGATGGTTSGQNTYSGFVLFNNPSVPVQARVGKSNAANIVSDISVAANVLYDGDVQFGRMRLNGTEYTQSGSGSWITMIRSICTHAANDQSDTFRRRFVHARFFYFLIYDGSTLVRDFAPVRVGQTGCLFDRVTGQFFYNQGTGSFVCGEDDFSIFSHVVKHVEVETSSRPYDAQVEYIESTGTQYIDTGVAVSDPSTIAIEVDEDVTQPLGFTHQNVAAGTWLARYSPQSATENLYIYYKNYRNRVVTSANETRKTARWDGSSGYYEDEANLSSFVASVGSDSIAGRNWLYGAVWDFNDNAVDFRSSRAGKIYGLKIKVSGVLVRDFQPVRVGTEYCLYDKANPTGGDNGDGLYHNKGTGAFLGGSDTGPSIVLASRVIGKDPVPPYDAQVEYIESSGTQWIDTGFTPNQNTSAKLRFMNKVVTGSAIIGYEAGNDSQDWRFFNHNTATYMDVWSGRTNSGTGRCNTNTWYEFEIGNLYVKNLSTGTVETSGTAISSFTGTSTIKLNLTKSGDTPSQNKFAWVKIYDNGVLVRDLIPVRVGTEYCMYDQVNPHGGDNGDGLYHNKGSGSFTGGSDTVVPTAEWSVLFKAVRKHYDMPVFYRVDECNGNTPTTVNANFPSGKYDALNYTPVWEHHRFAGWSTKPTSASYGSDGLVAMWDGIENAGFMTHNSTATVWKDLIGNASLTSRVGTPVVKEDSIEFDGSSCFYATGLPLGEVRTVEVCVEPYAQTLGKTDPEIIRLTRTGASPHKVYLSSANQRFNIGVHGVFGVRLGSESPINKITTVSYILYPSPVKGYLDASLKGSASRDYPQTNVEQIYVGNNSVVVDRAFMGRVFSVRLYNKALTESEIARNVELDKIRFNTDSQDAIDILPSDGIIYGVTDIYATWQLPATVTFDATTNGGQMPSGWTSPDYYEGQPYGTLPAPTKSGEVFLGWFTSGGTRVTESSVVTTGTLTARYAAVTWATTYSCTTTSSYKNTGIYAANRYSSSDPIVVDWGDGTTDVVYGNISQLAHTYPSATTYTVKISDNISTFCPSYNNSTWYQTTSQNQYTFKKVLTLSSKVTQLSAYAFRYCSAMTDALIPASATTIPENCFSYCSTLKSVTLPSTITSIGHYAFYNCTGSSFTSVTIPASVTSVGSYAFGYCYYLKNITFESGSSNLTLNTYSFAYCFYQSTAVGTIDLSPRKITSIPNYCFYYCRYLKGITWPQGLTSIGGSAFRYCFYYSTSTGTAVIPEGVTTISSTYAFANCLYLTAVTLPSTLTNLNNYTFYYCTRLATITSNRSTAPTVSAQTFGNSSTYYTGRTSYSAGTNKLYVPAGATGYNASYWASVLLDSTKCGFTLEYAAYVPTSFPVGVKITRLSDNTVVYEGTLTDTSTCNTTTGTAPVYVGPDSSGYVLGWGPPLDSANGGVDTFYYNATTFEIYSITTSGSDVSNQYKAEWVEVTS